jgi:hypothetical protein
MQDDNQRSAGREIGRDIAEHPQIAWIGAESGFLARLRGISARNQAGDEQGSGQNAMYALSNQQPINHANLTHLVLNFEDPAPPDAVPNANAAPRLTFPVHSQFQLLGLNAVRLKTTDPFLYLNSVLA